MSILVVGSIALDTVETPNGKADNSPGGSALYFSAAASFFAPVNVVGVVGEDFNFRDIEFLKKRNVDLNGLVVEKGETFRWGGRYHQNMNERDTLFTYLNVFETFRPHIPDNYKESRFVFLANIAPELQLNVLKGISSPLLTILDTMNFWISGRREALEKVIKRVDVMILNDEEIRELTGVHNINRAAAQLLQQGPRVLVIKKGEHGAVLITEDDYFVAPAFPVSDVIDPTGAGDSFAGGFVGYLASCPEINKLELRRAVVYGSTVASFNVESFSFNRLKAIDKQQIDDRVEQFREMMRF
ncbi:sugar kinase [candidate division KSB1 bacterium 4484_188]|nr:MAG: sugar kinase [candidate division KSB1 bacterium 4484_188]HFE65596.1 sugar kinase [Caldithrix sp.]